MQDAYKKYYQTKELALALEKTNNSRLIVFPSVKTAGKKDEWLKIGGNSALFYKYYIAPRLNKKPPTLHRDLDSGQRFNKGTISIRDKDSLIKNCKSLGYNEIKELDGLLIIDLKRKFTAKEIKELSEREKHARDTANALIRPANIHVELYHIIITLIQIIPHKVSKINEPLRSMLGVDLAKNIVDLLKVYINFANGQINNQIAKQKLSIGINNFNANLIVMNELELFDVKTLSRLGELVVDFKTKLKVIE